MATCDLFDEDLVCQESPDKGYVFGLVIENSEFLSSSEDEDEDDDMEDERVKKGSVRIAWHPDGKESVVEEKQLILVDRAIMPGDVIRSMSTDKNSQLGFVQDMEVTCHVRILGTDKYIYNIKSKYLTPLSEIPFEVTLDSWIGKTEKINRAAIIQLSDGARCKISDADLYEFDVVDEKRSRHSEYWRNVCYPHQVWKGAMGDLHGVEWLQSTMVHNPRNAEHKQYSTVTFYVESVEVESIEVHWLCRGFSQVEDPQIKVDSPPRVVKGDNLKRLQNLNWCAPCTIQVGDRSLYTITDSDKIETTPPRKTVVPEVIANRDENMVEAAKDQVAAPSDNTTDNSTDGTTVDASKNAASATPNGELEKTKDEGEDDGDDEYEDVDDEDDDEGNDSDASGSSRGSGPLRKKRGKRKATLQVKMIKGIKGRRPKMKTNFPERKIEAGEEVPVEICYTSSKANVIWQNGSTQTNILSFDLFPIHHIDDLEFFPGDYVVDGKDNTQGFTDYGVVLSCDHAARTCFVKWLRPYEVGKSKSPTVICNREEVSVYDIKDHPNYKFRPGQTAIRVGGFEDTEQKLSAVGQIYQVDPEGILRMIWSDSSESPCYPQELYLVSDELSEFADSESMSSSSDSGSSRSESDDTDASWETETEEEVSNDEDENKDASVREKECAPLSESSIRDLNVKMVEAHQSLACLDDMFQSVPSVATIDIADCYIEIVLLYKTCKSIDRLLKTKYFEDSELQKWLSALRDAHRKEKSKRIAQNINQVYNSYNHQLITAKVKESLSMDLSMDLDLSATSSPVKDKNAKNVDDPFSLESSVSKSTHLTNGVTDACGSGCSNAEANSNFNNINSSSGAWKDESVMEPDKDKHTETKINGTEAPDDAESICGAAANITSPSSNGDKNGTLVDISEIDLKITDEEMKFQEKVLSGVGYALNIYKRIKSIIAVKVQNELDKRWSLDSKPNNADANKATSTSGSYSNNLASEMAQEYRTNNDENLVESCCQQHRPEISPEVESLTSELKSEDDSKSKETKSLEEKSSEDNRKLNVSISLDDSRIAVDELGSPLSVTGFQMHGEVPLGHHYYSNTHAPNNPRSFMVSVQKELKLLQSSLPPGIVVKGFEDRMDLFSAMLVGPSNTPYEDGLFLFDLQLSPDYPVSPPTFHYISYCTERLNPNLYEDGKVCISLLGTWSGKGNELWCPKSNLLQIFVSVQGLILVKEPYYNEAGFEKQRGSQHAYENSRMYNEMAILKLVQSMSAMADRPPKVFEQEVKDHLLVHGPRMIKRLKTWIHMSGYSLSTAEYGESSVDPDRQDISSDQSDSKLADSNCDKDNSMGDNSSSQVNAGTDTSDIPTAGGDNSSNSVSQPTTSKSSFHEVPCDKSSKPDFPLFPVSKGFCLSLRSNLRNLEAKLDKLKKN